MQGSSRASAGDSQNSPRNTLHTAAAASAIWSSGSPEPPLRTISPTRLGTKTRDSQSSPGQTGSPRRSVRRSFKSLKQTSNTSLQQLVEADEDQQDAAANFQSGVRHAGWLWKRFGHGHRATWKKLWVFLCDDRLCYHQPEQADAFGTDAACASPTSLRSRAATAAGAMVSASMEGSPGLQLVGNYSGIGSTAGLGSTAAASLAALAAGEVRYIALDRIPVRPLPHRQHEFDPLERSHPDVGVTLVDDGVTGTKPPSVPPRATFSLVAGSHTHYFAAESQHDAGLWVTVIREAWLHCFSHTARCTGGVGTLTTTAAGVAVSQKLMAENAILRESIQELNQQVTQANGEYWRKWVEEKAKNSVLESKMVNTATYEIVVRTGNIKGAATDARVYIELLGPDALTPGGISGAQGMLLQANRPATPAAAAAGNTSCSPGGPGSCLAAAAADSGGEVRLFDADSAVKPFQRGATDSFVVACYNVGLPARLKVWHDNTGRYPDWFLVDVKVRKQGARDWVSFPCNRWLSTQYEDGSISRVLIAGSSRPPVTYKVSVSTSDLRGAGTDANVYLQMHGQLGDGLQHQLLGGATAFDRGAKDEFFIDDQDLGELTAVTISHDGSGTSPAWHLDHIEVLPWPSSAPCSPMGNTNTSMPWAAGAADDTAISQTRRMSAASPSYGMRVSLGSPQQQLRKSSSGRNGSPVPYSQTRAGMYGEAYLFPCNAWLDETLGGGHTKRRLPVASCLDPKTWYTVYITTLDVRSAGTDADVHIALTGTQGSSGRVDLPSQPQQYQRGQRDKTRLQLPPLGQLQKLLIGINNKGQAPSWHLALVEVVDENTGAVTYFAANRWLGALSSDGLSEVTLTASSTDPRQAKCEYQVCFLTSTCRGAGTDSCVSFELRGSQASSGPVTVSAGHDAFQRGGSDSFSYKWPHLGQLQQLVVWHDNSGVAAAGGKGPWCLDSVVVSCKADQQAVTFPYGGWLSTQTKLKVELQPGQTKGPTTYRFEVVTSDVRGAGTEAAVSLELCGPAGTTAGPWVLDRQGAFGRGQVDSFTVEGASLHTPTALKVTLQATQQSPAWHLDHIVCTVLEGKETAAGRKYYFFADRWFDSAAGTTSAVLTASSQLPAKHAAEQRPYTVKVYTTHLRGAGTDCNVCINAIGTAGSSGWRELPARHGTFEQGQEDVFTVLLPNLGILTHLGIKSDGSGQHKAWHLEKVSLQLQQDPALQQPAAPPVWFIAHRWLDAAHGLEVLLPAQAEDPASNLVAYQVKVYTSDVKNAGTDCRVFLQLTGEAGTGPPTELQEPGGSHAAGPAPFQRGSVDSFTLQLPVLGPLNMAAVWLEGRGSPWHLDLIVVTGPQGDQTFFVCGAWLGSGASSFQGTANVKPATFLAPVELPASVTDPRKAFKEYKVVTYTSNTRGAGTDAGVYVELIDTKGVSSGRKQLVTSSADAFERGSVDEFRIKCQALGSLIKLRVGHDGKGSKPAWHLAKAEVTDMATGKTWYFAADCWLDASQGDKAIERLLLASDSDPWADMTTYKVTVFTSSRQDAGATTALAVTLYGSKGPPVTSTAASQGTPQQGPSLAAVPMTNSGRCELSDGGEKAKTVLEPGRSCSFVLPSMQGLGQLRQLLLEVDTAGMGVKGTLWHCQHVEVADTKSGETWLFPCNAWLGSAQLAAPASQAPKQQQECEPAKLLLPAANLDGLFRQLREQQELEQKEQYKIAVYTSMQSPEQGCVSAVVLTLTAAGGGAVGSVRLSKAPQQCFGAGICDVFEVTADSKLGDLQHAKVVCELTSAAGSWHLDTIAVTAQSTGTTTWFYAGRWFDARAGLEAVLQGSPTDARAGLMQYKITTHTSDVDGAGTSAHVSMVLSGSSGSSSSLDLSHPSSISHSKETAGPAEGSRNGFCPGDAASFVIRCEPLGDLQQLVVWHDSSGPQPAWHLAYVEVAELSSGKVWYFACNMWLDSRRANRATRRTLQATTNFNPDSLLMRYCVRAVTGDVRGAATDSPVFIDIGGQLGRTGPKQLKDINGRTPTFDRGTARESTVSGSDVGEMTHVTIALDNTGLLSSWFLDELEVEHMGTGQVLRFKVGRWLDDKRPGCSLQYELWPHTEQRQPATQSTCKWELVLVTGKVPGAGTDADVSAELRGTLGTFGPHMLPASTEAFQEGCRDAFSLDTQDLGELLTLTISHNSKGRRPTWYLEGVELFHHPSNTHYSWHVGAWLNPDQGCSKTLRVAQVQRGPLQVPVGAPPGSSNTGSNSRSCTYQLEVQTADVEGAGTTANMFVQLGGVLCEAEAVQLTSSAGSSGGAAAGQGAGPMFQRGCLDVFILRGMPDVGPFTHLIIGHDGAGAHPGWCLAWVRVINLTSGAKALFTGDQWLDANRPGCQNWVKLPAGPDEPVSKPQRQQPLPQQQQPGQLGPRAPPVFGVELQQVAAAAAAAVPGGSRFKGWLHSGKHVQPGYNVTFSTSNIWGAGTGSKVFFELLGEHGSTGVVYPTGPRSQFSRGCTVSFLYPRLPFVGQLHQLRVGTDGSGLFSAWHLRQVEVTHVHTGQRWLFDCNEWLDRQNTWQLLLPAEKA